MYFRLFRVNTFSPLKVIGVIVHSSGANELLKERSRLVIIARQPLYAAHVCTLSRDKKSTKTNINYYRNNVHRKKKEKKNKRSSINVRMKYVIIACTYNKINAQVQQEHNNLMCVEHVKIRTQRARFIDNLFYK